MTNRAHTQIGPTVAINTLRLNDQRRKEVIFGQKVLTVV